MLNQTRGKEESIGSKDPIPSQTEQLSVDRKTAKAKGLLDEFWYTEMFSRASTVVSTIGM